MLSDISLITAEELITITSNLIARTNRILHLSTQDSTVTARVSLTQTELMAIRIDTVFGMMAVLALFPATLL